MSDGQDWPHDPDGEEGSEGMRKYGHAILAKKLGDDSFPVERSAFVEEHGEEPVRINYRRVVSVADIFEHVPEEEFESFPEFHKAVGRGMRSGGFWDYDPDVENPDRQGDRA